ncbi:MAG: STAS domain-containing protein [Nitriliruptoraceae bacterium]
MKLLDIDVAERAGWTVIVVSGQLDVATAPEMRQVLKEAQYDDRQHLVVDLTGLEFLDSFGLGVLVGALRRARMRGGRFVLAGPNARIREILEVTELDRIFQLAADVATVVDGGAPQG